MVKREFFPSPPSTTPTDVTLRNGLTHPNTAEYRQTPRHGRAGASSLTASLRSHYISCPYTIAPKESGQDAWKPLRSDAPTYPNSPHPGRSGQALLSGAKEPLRRYTSTALNTGTEGADIVSPRGVRLPLSAVWIGLSEVVVQPTSQARSGNVSAGELC